MTRTFKRRINKAFDALEEGNFDYVVKEIDKLFDRKGLNLYETYWLWYMKSLLAEKIGDRTGQLASLNRTISGGAEVLSADIFSNILSTKFALEVDLGFYADALDTHDLIAGYPEYQGDREKISTLAASIEAFKYGDEYLVVDGKIYDRCKCGEKRGTWQYPLLRRKISFQSVTGALEKFELRCEWKHFTDKLAVGKTWEVPPSWGDCRLLVFDDIYSTFQVVESPDSGTDTANNM